MCVHRARSAAPCSHVPNTRVVGNLYGLEVPTSRPSHPLLQPQVWDCKTLWIPLGS